MAVIRGLVLISLLLLTLPVHGACQGWQPIRVGQSQTSREVLIWFQAGVGDSDKLLGDRRQLDAALQRAGIRATWINVATTQNTVAARTRGIKRLPSFIDGGRRHEGYDGPGALLSRLGIEESTASPEQASSPLPAIPRRPATEVPVTRSELDRRLETLVEGQERQGELLRESHEQWRKAITSWNKEAAEFNASIDDVYSRIDANHAQIGAVHSETRSIDNRFAEIHARLAAVEAVDAPAVAPLRQNKELNAPEGSHPSLFGKWSAVASTAAKIGLAVAAPEVSLPAGGLGVAAMLLRYWWRRPPSSKRERPQRRRRVSRGPPGGAGRSSLSPSLSARRLTARSLGAARQRRADPRQGRRRGPRPIRDHQPRRERLRVTTSRSRTNVIGGRMSGPKSRPCEKGIGPEPCRAA